MEIRYDSSKGEVAPTIIDGPVPVDQSALIAQITGERDAAVASATKLQGKIAAILADAEARKAADATSTEGQGVIDIINAP